MKILYFTDTHVRKTAPKNRLDNYYETVLAKFKEIIDYSNDNDVDFIIHGGDLFDRPDVSVTTVTDITKLFMSSKAPIYIISGNHDIYGYNRETINRTMLGLLINVGILQNIPEDGIVIRDGDLKVCLIGRPFVHDIDSSPSNYIIHRDDYPEADYYINVAHGFLIDRPFIKGVPHTLIEDIRETEADITLVGHYHTGFGIVNMDSKYFVNPGSMMRVSNSISEMSRVPKFVILELGESISIREVPIRCALPGDQVLNREYIEINEFKAERMYEFIETIESSMNFKKLNLYDLVNEITNSENFDPRVKDEAIKRISRAEMGEE